MHWLDQLRADGDRAVRLDTDFGFYCQELLKLRPKSGGLVPFVLNPAQLELHRRLEDQKARTGRVRAIVLKARQLGCSSYTAARFYKLTTASPGLRTIVIGHERAASKNLYQLVRRFHDNLPDEMKPRVGVSNADELIFDSLDSGYIIATATEEGAGRSATAQNLHASEVAFWKDLPTQFAALMQTIPDQGTEVILESTANGYNDFNQLWRKAEAGQSEFMPVFLPWSIDPSYRTAAPEDFRMTDQEAMLAELHGLDTEQLCWRRNKISQLSSEDLFAQEYPLTADEAFISDSFDSYIPSELVLKARRRDNEANSGYLIVGVDPAGRGADRTSIAWRRGSCIEKIESRRGLDTMQVAGLVAKIIRDDAPSVVNVDVGGLGVGVYDRLVEQGYGNVVHAVNFGSKATEPPPLDELGRPIGGCANRRAEMYKNLRDALEGELSLPDSQSLQGDLTSIGFKYTSDGKLLLESKEDMRRRGQVSPDEADAVALCFTEAGGGAVPRSVLLNFNREIIYSNQGYY